MKKLIAIISGVSMAALIGGVSLAEDQEVVEEASCTEAETYQDEQAEGEVAQQQGRVLLDSDWNEAEKNSRRDISSEKHPGDEDGDDIPKGSGDPMKGLLGGKGVPCKPCDFPGGGTVNTGDDDEGEDDATKRYGDPLKGLNVEREKKKGTAYETDEETDEKDDDC